jgi:phosphoesterase RecJ-like protein
MFRRSGANHHDTEDLINVPQQIASVNVTALLVEEDDGRIRLSLRSKRDVDVSRIAGLFGGGGHARAAGARRAMPLVDFKRDVIREVLAAVDA